MPPTPFCHDEQQLAETVSWLVSNEPRKVLVVAGVVGSGRRTFLECLATRLTEVGRRTEVVALRLDGFEPTAAGVAGFVEFRLAFGRPYSAPLSAQFRKLFELVKAADATASTSARWAICFALLFELETPGLVLTQLLGVTERLTPERVLLQVVAHAVERAAWLLHVAAESTLSDATVDWLLVTVLEARGVSVAFSCALSLPSEVFAGRIQRSSKPHSVRRLELRPIEPEQAEARLRELASLHRLELDKDQIEDLAKAAQGSEGRLGRELSLQLRAAGSQLDDRSPRARLAVWFAGLGDDEPKLRRVLEWAAACGDAVPILPLLAAAELSQADAERFIDRLDDELCGEAAKLPLFDDLAYRHPGFPGLSVYRFRDRALHLALLDQADATAQQTAEHELLQFLSTRMAQATRGLAQLFVNLTERVQFELSAGPRQRLRLWVGAAEQADLQALLTADVSAGRLPAEALLRTSLQDQALPPTARLALLEAAATKESELPHERRVMLASLRTELLAAVGRIPEALASAEQGLAVLSSQQPEPLGLRGLLLFLSANCHRRLGQWDLALVAFRQAADEASKPRPDGSVDFQNWGVCLAEAGHCHAERQEWADAAKLLREGIATLGRVPATEGRMRDEQLAQLEHNLAVCEAKLQEAAAASG